MHETILSENPSLTRCVHETKENMTKQCLPAGQ